ncbi:MAG: M3 family metallopeptidase [Muribaculaceae bacterium]
MTRLQSIILTVISSTMIMSAENVLLKEFKTTHGAIPFDKIQNADYEPAIDFAINEQNAEIELITSNPEAPTFENTIVALDRSGSTLGRVLRVFDALLNANADDQLLAISEKIMPKCSAHSASIILNEALWKRIKSVHDNCNVSKLDAESKTLLKNTYNTFVNNGASLEGADRDKYRSIMEQLSAATLKYGQNALKATSAYNMWLTADQLEGLPESAIEAARNDARNKNNEGGEYLITLQFPSYSAFMKYSSNRDLRKQLYMAYNSQCTSGEYNNTEIEVEIAYLRYQLAQLLGFKNYAEYNLTNTMAANPANVYKLLDQLRDSYRDAQKAEVKELSDYASKLEGKKITIMPWDYSYYFEKLKDSKYSFNDEALRPYFELNNVIAGVFGFATRMYGLHFTENYDAQVYHADVKVYDVTDEDGNFIGMLYADFFPRSTKRSGAWMTEFGAQYIDKNGKDVRPLITIVTNFTPPTDTKPSLLTFYEVETFLHEFGHALHGLITKCKYASLSGTSVYHDFVELPSQFNENYLTQKEFLDSFAKHYLTGEKIPQDMIDKIIASSQFGAAYSCVRQLNFGYLDMAWHTTTAKVDDPVKFEENATKSVQIFAPVEGTAISPKFTHIFSGGYAAGYYGYKWAEVLDADAFSKFLENGIFDQETAHSFRDNILKRGGSEDPMVLYKRFRGQEPTIDALLKRDGIKVNQKKSSKKK